jgi:hypothetical protein
MWNYNLDNCTLTIRCYYPKRKAHYKGKLLLTDAEFLKFKEACADKDTDLSVIELNSRAPVLVDFSITLPHTKSFPFGHRTEDTKNDVLMEGIFMMVLLFIGSGGIAFLVLGISKIFGWI